MTLKMVIICHLSTTKVQDNHIHTTKVLKMDSNSLEMFRTILAYYTVILVYMCFTIISWKACALASIWHA